MTWRTAHLVVSGMAFAVWTAASIVYFVMCDNAMTDEWYLYAPAAILPSFWCVYAWFAVRRPTPSTSRGLTILALPVLMMGLGTLPLAITDAVAEPPDGFNRPIGMGVGMGGGCCWELSVPFGLISFVCAVGLQFKSLRRPSVES